MTTLPTGIQRIFHWRRLITTAATAVLAALPVHLHIGGAGLITARALIASALVLGLYGVLERWPARLPRPIARWALQVIIVALSIPVATTLAHLVLPGPDPDPFWSPDGDIRPWALLTIMGLLSGPWVAICSLLRQVGQREEVQALAFALERSGLERRASDARLRLLQAQVEPHFLFNTLANVRQLIDPRSVEARSLLDSLIAYLRAAVPRIKDPASTMKQELDLVTAYLQVMQMRLRDRLSFSVEAADDVHGCLCPPMIVLTLVENAIRHGIDPSERGGHIGVEVRLLGGRLCTRVVDTGRGMSSGSEGLGTGLSLLRERIALAFPGNALFSLDPNEGRGVTATMEFPAHRVRG